MKALYIVHMGVPVHNAGAEWTLHAMAGYLRMHGIDIDVAVGGPENKPSPIEGYVFEGITYLPLPATRTERCELAADYDLLFTHLDRTRDAVHVAAVVQRPLVHYVHNDAQLRFSHVRRASLVIFNSQWIAAKQRWKGGPSLVCHPLVDVERYRLDDHHGKFVTLIGASIAKGVDVLQEIALRCPERQFLNVVGAYGPQTSAGAPNVGRLATTQRIVDVYRQTRVLLMPSSYESFGRTAVEAACSGIPTIAAPTPGLKEALGEAGTYAERTELGAWVAALEGLDDEDTYARAGALARERARELETRAHDELDALAVELERIVESRRPAPKIELEARPDANVLVVIPFDSDDDQRIANARYVVERLARLHPGWRIAVGGYHDGPWRKGLALHLLLDAVRRAEPPMPDVLVVLDADCYLSAGLLEDAVARSAAGAPWVVPHMWVKKWSKASTEQITSGGMGSSVERQPGRARAGGGCVVLRSEVYDECPMDPRFEGWGGEDWAWGMALQTLYGPPYQGGEFLFHLWHDPSVRSRVRPVEIVSRDLLGQYQAANGNQVAMRSLIDAAKVVLYDQPHAVSDRD